MGDHHKTAFSDDSIAAISRQTKYEDLPDLLTMKESHAYTDIGLSSLYELCRTGKLPHRKFGRIIRIYKSAFAPLSKEAQ